jgi:hypothetical protein
VEVLKWLHEAVCRKKVNFGPVIGFCDDGTGSYSTTGVQKMFSIMAASWG